MSGGGGGSKNQTVTNNSEPYKQAQPMINESLQGAQNLYRSGALYQNPYPGQTVAGAAPETQQGWAQTSQIAGQGSPLVGASSDYLQSVLSPQFLSMQSAGLEDVLNNATNRANAAVSLAGRSGSGTHSGQVAGAVAPYLFQDYGRRQGLQMQAAGMAPGINQAQYYGAQQLQGVGQQRQAQLQDEINAEINRYNALQNAPLAELSNYQNLLGFASPYGQSSQTGPKQPGANPWLTAAGAVASLGGGLLGNPGLFV